MRKRKEGVYDEGRGGWTLQSYFSVPKDSISYHGFMHPKGDYRYYGCQDFWINAHLCTKKNAPAGFEPSYSCTGYDDFVTMFDSETGLLLHPYKGDVQYSNSEKDYIVFDGTAWVKPKEKLVWEFDYSKYISMFNIPIPHFVFIQLGLNDFRGNLNADFARWGQQVNLLAESVKKVNPNVIIGICIPCSTCGSIENDEGIFTPKQNAAMFRFRDWLINTFDHCEEKNIFLIDTGICIDEDNGYANNQTFNDIKVQTGLPHPRLSYPQMGIPLAAFIQYNRQTTNTK